MNSAEYKNYHESFMENNHGSTATHTFFCIFFTVQCSIYSSLRSQKNENMQYIYEYIFIVLPLILAHTILSSHIYFLNIIIFILILYEFCTKFQKLEISKTLKLPNQFPKHLNSITCLRGLTYLITVCCILAVDFKAFPRYLAKTETYGFSLMDTGVGLFVLMSGLVHKDLSKNNLSVIVKSNTKFISILFFLGVTRYISVKQLNYHEHVTEYGVHWNFFFTLAFCKSLSTLFLLFWNRPLPISIITILVHELLLYKGLGEWVFSNSARTDLVSANREGISSCLGYVSLYLFAVSVKNELNNKSVCRNMILIKLVLGSIFLWSLLFIVNSYFPISRTLANSAYCLYLKAVFVNIMTVMYFIEILSQDREKGLRFDVPKIILAVNSNGLIYFLAANLLTGFVNLSIRTLFVPNAVAFIILNVYMILTIALTVYLNEKGIKI